MHAVYDVSHSGLYMLFFSSWEKGTSFRHRYFSLISHTLQKTKIRFCILMYVPCIMYSLLFRPTNALYISTIFCISLSTATCFGASASSSGNPVLLF